MDKQLFAQLYEDHRRTLLLYIYSICGDFGLSEELVNETFVKAMLSLSDDHENFKAWLFAVGKNLTLNKLKREAKVTYTDDIGDMKANDDILAELITNEKNRKLYEAIQSMPDKMRQVVTLHYFSGLSLIQIGEIMGMNPGNVRIVAFRARQHLKKELEENHDL